MNIGRAEGPFEVDNILLKLRLGENQKKGK